MSNILTNILTQRRQQLATLKTTYPEEYMAEQAAAKTLQVRPRSLSARLRQQRPGFILECKQASPSQGLIRADFNPAQLAKSYAPYAAAISVLTEPDFFAGSFAHLQAVSAQVNLPVLCKDFIISRYQVALARYFGADAILLMLSVLDDDSYLELASYANELKLEYLTEVANAEEMQRALALNAPMIGINHRDLTDLTINLNRTAELAPFAPKDTLIIAESGIYSHQDIQHLMPYAHGFLVGSSLMAEADLDLACRRLIYGEHKVCGLTQVEQAQAAAASGAYYGGLIFAQHSPRFINLEQAEQIVQQAPQLEYVGVFNLTATTHATLDHLLQYQQKLKLRALQLHGLTLNDANTLNFLQQLAQQKPADCDVWFALSVKEPIAALPSLPVERFLLDNGNGGSGQSFNWDYIPQTDRQRIMLAGGLGISNVRQALALNCRGLDFNSQLERAAGVKCPALIQQLFQTIRIQENLT